MPILVQVCIVFLTLAVIVMDIAIIGAFLRIERLTADVKPVLDSVERALQRLDRLADSSQQIAESVNDVIRPLRHASGALGVVGERAANLSSEVIDRIEMPVRAATSVSRGVKAGLTYLIGRLATRWEQNGSTRAAQLPGGPETRVKNRIPM